MRYREGNRSERAGRVIPSNFEGPDPIIALLIAFHVLSAGGHGVTFDGLLLEGLSLRSPILEGAIFKIEIQRFPIGAEGHRSLRCCRKKRVSGEEKKQKERKLKSGFHQLTSPGEKILTGNSGSSIDARF
jgi:hypothetical protein